MTTHRKLFSLALTLLVTLALAGSIFLSTSRPVVAHASTSQAHTSSIVNFITRSGTTLYDGTTPFRFLGWNSASHTFFCDGDDPFEQQDFFKTAQQTGATVVRTMPWLVGYNPAGGPNNVNDGSPECFHITNPQTGAYNENMWRAIDQGIAYANQYDVRIMFPFVFGAYWNQDGYTVDGWAKFFNANYTETDFYTNPTIIQSFKNFLSWVLNRTNTVTGVQYKNDPTIFCWETGNELEHAPDSWSSDIAAYLKSIDPNHLVCDGNHSSTGSIDSNSLNDPNLDVIDRHYYGTSQISIFQNDISVVQGHKPLVVGEWGFMNYADSKTMIDTTVNNQVVAGSLLWSLDEHSRNGSFILDGSLNSINNNAGYRWPGFASGNAYDETSILNYQRSQAYAIRGLSVPPLTAPDPPTLLPTNSTNVIQWQGSVGASSYTLERATSANGPFSSVSTGLLDDQEALYNDTTAISGQSYYYRLTATNSGGTSGYSNVIGPVTAQGQAVHIDAGGPGTGTGWSADVDWHETGDNGGTANCNCTVSTTGVANAAPASVYQTERWGAAFSYVFNGLAANTAYTVRLHYAETDGLTTGQRQFNVYINQGQVESNLDVYAAVGANKALVRDYTAIANNSGQISAWFTSGAANGPDIRGVEVLPFVSGSGETPFFSGFERSDPQPTWSDTVDTGPGYGGNITNVGGICCGLTGPQASERTNEYAHTGNTALMYSGMDNSTSSSYAYMKIFDLSASAITVTPGMMLSYWIYPESQNNPIGGSYVSGNNSTCVAIDMIFSDGSTLRDSGAQDQHGNALHPSGQCNHLTLDTWNYVSVNLGAYVNGKTINRLDVGYDQAAHTGGYRGYIDDILIDNLSSGLVGDWTFNEGSGSTAADTSGLGNHGTLYSGTGWTPGRFGNAVNLNGSSAYIAAGVNQLPAANAAQSFSWWMNVPTYSGGNAIALTNDGAGSGVQAGIPASGQVGIWSWGGTILVAAPAPSTGTWHHYVYTFDGTTHRLYIDGILQATSTVTPQSAGPSALNFGRWDGGNGYLNGSLDDVRIYNRALSAGEVQLLATQA